MKNKRILLHIITVVVLLIYSCLIMAIIISSMLISKEKNGYLPERLTAISIVLSTLLIVPPAVMYPFIYRLIEYISLPKKFKEEQERRISSFKNEIKSRKEEFINKYNLPSYIHNQFEPNNGFASTKDWIVLGIFEFLALFFTAGQVFYMNNNVELIVAFVMIGIACGIYGFCYLCKARIKGIYISLIPVIAVFLRSFRSTLVIAVSIPLVVLHYVFKINEPWMLAIFPSVFGGISISALVIIMVKKEEKRVALIHDYNESLNRTYPERFSDWYMTSFRLWLDENKYALIEERNYFKVNDKVEFFGPNIETFSTVIEEIYDEDMNKFFHWDSQYNTLMDYPNAGRYLGDSGLRHNPITCPVNDYYYNKYVNRMKKNCEYIPPTSQTQPDIPPNAGQ